MNDRFKTDLSSLSYTGTSNSEDDFSSNFGNDNDALDNYNVSDKLKNLLRLGSFRMEDDLAQLDDESEDDSKTAAIREIEKRIPKETSENKYMNFPSRPPPPAAEEIEKEKKRPRKRRLRQEGSDNEEEHVSRSKKTKGKSGRKTRKEGTVSTMVDENGERLVRTTELLDSSEESSDEDRPMSKKEMLNMYRERERTLRSSELKIKPAMNVKSYDSFIKRRQQREQEEKQRKEQEKKQKQLELLKALEESSDSDLEIIYDSKLYITSPERGRQPPSLTSSPIRNGDVNHRNFNQNLVKRIYEQTHEHKKSMEEAAKARGHFVSASDRAQRLIEQERKAQLINKQIEQHFNRKPTTSLDDDMEDEEYDPDYNEDNENDHSDDNNDNNDDNNDNNGDHLDSHGNNSDNNNDDTETDYKETKVDSDNNADAKIKEMDATSNKTKDELNEENTQKKPRRRILSDSEESDAEDKPRRRIMSESDEDENTNKNTHTKASNRMDIDVLDKIRIKQKEKNDYVVEEASEEEDEYFGMGGPDVDETEDLDRYEQDGLLVENNEETDSIDKAALRTMFYEQDAESDRNMVERLLKDITSGGLRKRKAALEEGFMFDDIDIYDDDDDLIAVRKAAAAKRRRMLQEHGGALEALAKDPKTEAFVRAARATRDGAIVMLDDSEEEVEKEKDEDEENERFGKSLNAYLISDDEDEDVDEDEEMEEENIIPEADSEKDKHSDQANKAQEKIIHLSDDDDDDEDIPLFSLA
ncbi:unnamed protein product [Rhizopus stolonifer]